MTYLQNLTESDRYWYDLILRCRTSGLSDYQWLLENNIKSPTFYYHLKRLRQKACDIPEPPRKTSKAEIQEVVPVFFKDEELPVSNAASEKMIIQETFHNDIPIRLKVQGVCVEISNSASQILIQNTLAALHNLC